MRRKVLPFTKICRKTICLHFTKSMSQQGTLPGKQNNISLKQQKKIILLGKMFLANQDNFCPYEQALSG